MRLENWAKCHRQYLALSAEQKENIDNIVLGLADADDDDMAMMKNTLNEVLPVLKKKGAGVKAKRRNKKNRKTP